MTASGPLSAGFAVVASIPSGEFRPLGFCLMVQLRVLLLVALSLMWQIGCGASSTVTEISAEEANFKNLALLYGQCQGRLRRPPANLDEFKKFLEQVKADPGASIKVNDIEKFLISPRDNEPYVILWNVQARTGMPDVIAYEKTGADGTRMVAFGAGYIEYADEERFKQLVPGAK